MIERLLIKLLEGVLQCFHRNDRGNTKPDAKGFFLGTASHPYHPNRSDNVFLTDLDLATHFQTLGASGSGKTMLILNLVIQLMLLRYGFCLVDPHGDLINRILRHMGSLTNSSSRDAQKWSAHIRSRLILIEPFRQHSVGFNPLEATAETRYPLIIELISIFRKLWESYWGPRMEELLKNTFLTLSANNLTLLEANRLLTDESYRKILIDDLNLPEVKLYWTSRFNKLSPGQQSQYVEPLLTRLSMFTGDPNIRPIIGQCKSTFNPRKAMDNGMWILLNLNKGELKENTYILGALFTTYVQRAAMSRVNIPEKYRRPFYLIIDEMASFLGGLNDFESILSESRKMKLRFCCANQFVAQLDSGLKSALLGNTGVQAFFRVSHKDATYLSSELNPKEKTLIERNLVDLKVGQAYLKIKGQNPRIMKTAYVPDCKADPATIELIRQTSFAKYARPKAEVEQAIQKRSEELLSNDIQTEDVNKSKSAFTPRRDFEEGLDGW